jgi:uncharacterized membrane-anchored protein YitT (DUF2179 family)
MVKKLLTYLMVMAMALLMAISYQLFVFPNSFAPAGLNGLCTMIQYKFGLSIGYLNLLINVPLALTVFFLVSKPQALRSLAFVLAFSVFTLILERLDLSAFAYSTDNGTSTILGPVVGGIVSGFSTGIIFRGGANSGGTEFIASLIHKRNPQVNFFWVTCALNISVAILSYFVYDFHMEPVLLCILYSFVSSTVRDKMSQNSRSAVRFEIVTDDPEPLSAAIIQNLHHTSTLIPAKGMYKGKPTNILVCIINKSQVAELASIVRNFPNSFVIMSHVTQVIGNFKRLDSRGNEQKAVFDEIEL